MNVLKVNIKEIAIERGITTAYQLQKATNTEPNLAAKWFRNDLQSISIKTLNRLCNALKCEPSDLLKFTPDEDSSKPSNAT